MKYTLEYLVSVIVGMEKMIRSMVQLDYFAFLSIRVIVGYIRYVLCEVFDGETECSLFLLSFLTCFAFRDICRAMSLAVSFPVQYTCFEIVSVAKVVVFSRRNRRSISAALSPGTGRSVLPCAQVDE